MKISNRTYTAIGLVLVVVSIWAASNGMPRVALVAVVGAVLTIAHQARANSQRGKNEARTSR